MYLRDKTCTCTCNYVVKPLLLTVQNNYRHLYNKGHFLLSPKVSGINKFDCACTEYILKCSLHAHVYINYPTPCYPIQSVIKYMYTCTIHYYNTRYTVHVHYMYSTCNHMYLLSPLVLRTLFRGLPETLSSPKLLIRGSSP